MNVQLCDVVRTITFLFIYVSMHHTGGVIFVCWMGTCVGGLVEEVLVWLTHIKVLHAHVMLMNTHCFVVVVVVCCCYDDAVGGSCVLSSQLLCDCNAVPPLSYLQIICCTYIPLHAWLCSGKCARRPDATGLPSPLPIF